MGLTQTSERGVKISNAGTNGQFLQKQSGNTGGLTWADVPAGVGGSNGADFNDDVKIRLGTGNDLEIYHSGSDSFIKDGGTGSLKIGSSAIWLQAADYSETMASFTPNGAVDLYYDNSKKFETTSAGASMDGLLNFNGTGTKILLADSGKIKLGGGPDLEIYHDGSNSYITETSGSTPGDLRIQANNLKLANWDGGGTYIYASNGGSVDLYYDNGKKFETKNDGVKLSQGHFYADDNSKIKLGDGPDLELYHDGTNSRIYNTTGYLVFRSGNYYFNNVNGTENCLDIIQNGSVKLYYDHSNKFETVSYGVVAKGSVEIQSGSMTTADSSDNGTSNSAIFGTGSDLKIYHNGNHSFLHNSTGDFVFEGDSIDFWNAAGNESLMKLQVNSGVELYYDNSKTFETVTGGVLLKGIEGGNCHLYMHADEGDDAADKWLQLAYASGSEWQLRNYSSGSAWETSIQAVGGGKTSLYYDNSEKFETQSTGITVRGADSGDQIKIIPEGTNAYGTIDFESPGSGGGKIKVQGEDAIKIIKDGGVELYHNNVKKFETTSAGGTLTGTWTGAGRILQVVTAFKSDSWSASTNNSFHEVTGLAPSITPSSSSNKILVMISLGCLGMNNHTAGVRIYRGSTNIANGAGSGNRPVFAFGTNSRDSYHQGGVSYSYIDSPGTTSSTTYKIYAGGHSNGTVCVNRTNGDQNDSNLESGRRSSSITLMEISA